jgi:hypothetical protein
LLLINSLFAKLQIDSDKTPHSKEQGAPPKVSRRVMIARSTSSSCVAVFIPSRSEVSHNGKPIFNQFSMLEFSSLGTFVLQLLLNLSANRCRSHIGRLG